MANGDDTRFRHFVLEDYALTEKYESPRGGGGKRIVPARKRSQHGGSLLDQLGTVRREAERVRAVQEAAELDERLGLSVEFESYPEIELAVESLSRESSGIELLNVRHVADLTYATVFVPDGKLEQFERLIQDYLEEKRDSLGRARDNQKLVDSIQNIRAATLRALWTDDPDLFPEDDDETFWWEVWLPIRGHREELLEHVGAHAQSQGLKFAPGVLEFPERSVVLAYGSAKMMKRSMVTLNNIAELRRAKETAEFYDELPLEEQRAWLDDLLGRSQFPAANDSAPSVCILDTGVNRGHPLLEQALAQDDMHTVKPAWGMSDDHGHGTEMAGLALAGDLVDLIEHNVPVHITHRLESVKLIPHDGANTDDPHHHGYLTTEAVARPEVTAPRRHRVFSMAVTARDNRDRGRPSAWSSAIDRLASDAENQGEHPRLIVVSAGNVRDPNMWLDYPRSNEKDAVHDPAQAWNALTVGAYTALERIQGAGAGTLVPIAPAGGLSPFSTTSLEWGEHWPLKPDVLMEGGNAARDGLGAVMSQSLNLLTTNHEPTARLLTTTNATSAATALAARMAAQILSDYPDLWPETVRGLIVHSAEWTEEMLGQFLPNSPRKEDYLRLVRRCGFGVPNLERALWSASNSLTLLTQERVHPFTRNRPAQPKLRDMHLYELPWPRESLEALGESQVQMRVTLSYFIEPSPSARGPKSRYRYESHGLRFDVQRPSESVADFRSRVNAAARDEEEGNTTGGSDPDWLLGTNARHRGSLHSDIWRGTATDLASRGAVAVYPAVGWWKTRPRLERYDLPVRYALLVSILAPEVDVDLVTEIRNQIGVPITVET